MRTLDDIVFILILIGKPLVIVLLVMIGLMKDCCDDTDPLDRGDSMAKREIGFHSSVNDSIGCGFRLVYATVRNVTPERLEEIKSRVHIKVNFDKMSEEVLKHFNNSLLYVDIYDFANIAKQYILDEDLELNQIFINGKEKYDLYVGENKLFGEKSAQWISPGTLQGIQWINRDDIWLRKNKDSRVYRYWKCTHPRARQSDTDERFSHFSEDERIWD